MSTDRQRVDAFLLLAEEEIQAARLLAHGSPRQAAYLVQQAAEKIARAVLERSGIAFGPGHNLGQMAKRLPSAHPWAQRITALDRHSPASSRYRYPSPTGRLPVPPSTEVIEADLVELEEYLSLARTELDR